MQSTTEYFPVEHAYQRVGALQDPTYPTRLLTSTNVSLPVGKDGVTEGVFTPGTYRVTAFEAARVGYFLGKENLEAAYVAGYYKYCCKIFDSLPHGYAIKNAYDVYPLPTMSDYRQKVLQKAQAKVGGSDLSLGEDVGEIRETIEMLRSPMSSLKKFFLDDSSRNLRLLVALARDDRKGVGRLLGRTTAASLDAMSGAWMELRYGFRPLVFLLGDVIDLVDRSATGAFDPLKIRKKKAQLLDTEEFSYHHTFAIGSMAFETLIEVKDVLKQNASVQYRQSAELSGFDQFGLSPRFWPETAWGLTRLSFVLDWLLDISTWLQTLRFNPDCTVLGNTVGVKLKRTIKVRGLRYRYNYSKAPWITWNTTAMHDYEHYQRWPNVDLSYLPHFTWDMGMDLFKAIDSVSLLWQLVIAPLTKQRR
jgi:hypothetical protein